MPTDRIVFTLREAPSRMIAPFRIFLDVNFNAGLIHSGWKKLFMMVPINSAMMDAPNRPSGISCSSITEAAATEKQIRSPRANSPRSFVLDCI